ncbi:hypothetical protein MUK72_15600 (plasmid) [Halococcus dombrowskii]|uniref:Uncharacterized protein n=1 Tax=Halococcus dombrowskii TaxID=179637 RepID=A0AAV3SBM3_HALDO|nr:hypothetical protein [Halococcus dombrowskii]UOO96619.1 hypothetical protein MUK72_15600 [Halococcus dombrowskii]
MNVQSRVSQFVDDMMRTLAVGGLLLLAIAAYGAITIGASISIVSSTALPTGMIVLGAMATLIGVGFAIIWPRVSGPGFALGGIICTGMAGSFPGAQASDPAVALILAMFGIPVLVAAWEHFKG